MKNNPLKSFQIAALLICTAATLRAQTDSGRQYKLLKDQYSKAIVDAVTPINQRHQKACEQLLLRATQANDLATAAQITEELKRLGAAANAAGSGASTTSRFHDSVWKMQDGKQFTLNADGTTKGSWTPRKGTWKITGPDAMVLDPWNVSRPEKVRFNPEATELIWESGGKAERQLKTP